MPLNLLLVMSIARSVLRNPPNKLMQYRER